jgi:hypothetical protein
MVETREILNKTRRIINIPRENERETRGMIRVSRGNRMGTREI